ncbi:MAG: cysteine peptidase family C39 domain-containing protein [Isosphaeraceae bacterium]
MVLAAFGTDVEESTMESQARLEEDGTEIAELERFARKFGLIAEIHEANIEQLRQFLAEGKLAMAYIDRAMFDLPPRLRGQPQVTGCQDLRGRPGPHHRRGSYLSRSSATGSHHPQVHSPVPRSLWASWEPLRRLLQAGTREVIRWPRRILCRNA